MFTFDGKFKVLSKENMSIPRRDGSGNFEFEKVVIQTTDKKKTKFEARISDYDEPIDLVVGGEYNLTISVGSSEVNGRIFVNLTVIGINATLKQPDVAPIQVDECDEVSF